MAASGSRGRDQASAGADALDTLANPNLANLTAAELVVHLHSCNRSGSDFADAALVLSVRERELELAEAQAQAREAKAITADLRDQIRALEELGTARNALVLVRNDNQDQSQVAGLELQIGACDLTAGEIGVPAELPAGEIGVPAELELQAPAVEIEDGVCFDAGIKATPAEVRDNKRKEPADNKEKEKKAVVGCPAGGASGVAAFEDSDSGERSTTSSSSRSRARDGDRARGGARAGAPDAPDQLNPEFATMPAADLIAHLKRYRRPEDFADAAQVLAVRERNLLESQALLRRVDGVMDGVRDEISRHERTALELRAQINRAAETEARLRARIQLLLELRGDAAVRHGSDPTASEIGVHDLTLTDRDDEGVGFDAGVHTMLYEDEDSDDYMPVPLEIISPCEGVGGFDAGVRTIPPSPCEGVGGFDAGVRTMSSPSGGEVGDDVPIRHSPLRICAAPPVPVPLPGLTRQAEQIAEARPRRVLKDILSSNDNEAQGEEVGRGHKEILKDVLVITTGSQEKWPARSTKNKKARGQKGVSFYNMVFKALKEKEELLKKKDEEKNLVKEASKQLYQTSSWSSKSTDVEEDSDYAESSQN